MQKTNKTVKDYPLTPEKKAWIKAYDIDSLKKKLPYNWKSHIRQILLDKGFDYSEGYIYTCLRTDSRQTFNHYVIEIAQAIQVEMDSIVKKGETFKIRRGQKPSSPAEKKQHDFKLQPTTKKTA